MHVLLAMPSFSTVRRSSSYYQSAYPYEEFLVVADTATVQPVLHFYKQAAPACRCALLCGINNFLIRGMFVLVKWRHIFHVQGNFIRRYIVSGDSGVTGSSGTGATDV